MTSFSNTPSNTTRAWGLTLIVPVLIGATLALTGCTQFDPYQRTGTWHANNAINHNIAVELQNPSDLIRGESHPVLTGGMAVGAISAIAKNPGGSGAGGAAGGAAGGGAGGAGAGAGAGVGAGAGAGGGMGGAGGGTGGGGGY